MGYEDTRKALDTLNGELMKRYAEDDPLMLDISGKPELQIKSFNPLVYREYGKIRNRPPQVNGSVALRAFLAAPTYQDSTVICAAVEAGSQSYGFVLDSDNPLDVANMNDIVRKLGHSNIQLRPTD